MATAMDQDPMVLDVTQTPKTRAVFPSKILEKEAERVLERLPTASP